MFTDEELETAVAKIIRTSIRREFGPLGNRRTDLSFNDTKDAAAGVYILFPNAIFYTVYLAAQRLLGDIEVTRGLVGQLSSAIAAADRKVTPVEDISSLANARAGLEAMKLALEARVSAFQKLSNIPSYQRFEKSTQAFLDKVGVKIKEANGIVLTPTEARAQLTRLYTELRLSFMALRLKAIYLGVAVEDFEQLNLPGLLSNTVIGNAQRVLGERFDELEALTPEQRLAILRGVTLDVLAARSAVRGFASFNTSTVFLELTGSGSVFSDADHPLEPATIYADSVGPYTVVPALPNLANGREHLELTVDGTTNLTVYLLGSFVARLEGGIKGPFDIGDPNGIGNTTTKFSIGLRNYPDYGDDTLMDVELAALGSVSAYDLSYYVNLEIGLPAIVRMEPYSNPLKLLRNFDLEVTSGTTMTLRVGGVFDHRTLGLKVGDHFLVNDDSSVHDRKQLRVTAVNVASISAALESTVTTLALTDETQKNLEFSEGAMAVRFVVGNTEVFDIRIDSIEKHQVIYLPKSTQGNDTWQQQALNNIGLIPVMESRSRGTATRDLVKQFNATSATAVGGVARVVASYDFVAHLYQGPARTDPNDFTRLVCGKLYERGKDVTAGTEVTFSTNLAEESEVHVGDAIVLRSHSDSGLIGTLGVVTAVTATGIDATMDTSITAAEVDFEVGPTLPIDLEDKTAMVSGGSLNDGEYTVKKRDVVPFEVQVASPFPVPSAPGNQPRTCFAGIGAFRAIFQSTSTSIGSQLRYDFLTYASAVPSFTSEDFQEAVGQTRFFQLPEVPKGLEEGDVLELYPTQYNAPSFTSPIAAFDAGSRVVELSAPLPVTTPAYSFGIDVPVPFARIRKKRRANYEQLRNGVAAWASRFDSQERYFTEISRALNGVVINKNPTIIQTNDARARVVALSNNLDQLVAAITAYVVDVVPEVDNLVQSFKEKGADRAVALLLEARVNAFFALTQEEASYAGMLQKSIKDVQREDLPIRKTGRDGRYHAADATIAAYDEVDFEFDHTDADTAGEPDLLGNQEAVAPGNIY